MILDWDEGEGGRMTGKHQASARNIKHRREERKRTVGREREQEVSAPRGGDGEGAPERGVGLKTQSAGMTSGRVVE